MVYPSALYLDTFRIWVYGWVELLRPVVMSYHTSLPSFMLLSLACALVLRFGLPSIVMRVDRGEVRCRGLSNVWLG
jgi:hypothetical protein